MMDLHQTKPRGDAWVRDRDDMLPLALCTLGLQPGRLPLTRTAPLARAVSPQLQLAQLDVEGTNVEVICSALNPCSPAAHTH